MQEAESETRDRALDGEGQTQHVQDATPPPGQGADFSLRQGLEDLESKVPEPDAQRRNRCEDEQEQKAFHADGCPDVGCAECGEGWRREELFRELIQHAAPRSRRFDRRVSRRGRHQLARSMSLNVARNAEP